MKRFGPAAGVRRGTLFLAAMCAASVVALGGAASSALASGFSVFSQCPVSNPEVAACVVGTASGGEFTIGNKNVPIVNPIVLQGGIKINEETGAETLVEPSNGETLSKTPQRVPGGLLGIDDLGGEVTATTELAGPASDVTLSTENVLLESGTALSLPVKLKIDNQYLGEKCYGGSDEHPIELALTTGTTSPPEPNKPIKGKAGELSTIEEGEILIIKNNSLVNNSFAAPGVHGCGFYPPLIDPLVNLAFGVPAAGGHNTAILNGKFEIASAEAVREHLG